MSDTREKKNDPAPKVKELLTGFEKGKLQINPAKSGQEEKPISRPGGTRKLTRQFEKIAEPSEAPEITRKTPKSPVSPSPISNGDSAAPEEQKTEPVAQAPTPEPAQTADAPPQPQTLPEDATPTQTEAPPKTEASQPATTSAPPKAEAPKTATATKKQSVLVVYADMERQGFNGEVLDATVNKLKGQGHTVEVSDLYRNKFNPLPSRQDAGLPATGGNFLYEEAMLAANINNKVSDDIKAEQARVQAADLVIFIFRLHPSGVPAMLTGYLNRVLSEGFAADFTSKAIFDQGKLKGKKALLCMSCLLNAENFSSKSEYMGLDKYLWPVQYGSLRYSGFDVLAPQLNDDYFFGGDTQQQALLTAWNKRLDNLQTEKALTFA